MDGQLQASAQRIIKRYANRKLYDTRESRYVTLQRIADFVRAGEDVHIIDNRSKEDLTGVTLAQIIYEEEKEKGGSSESSIGGLLEIIRHGRERLESLLHQPGGAAREPAASASATAATAADSLQKLTRVPREALDELGRHVDERVRALLDIAFGHVNQLQAEVQRLQGRIEELEARLATMAGRSRED